jgi:hypothetical protein
MKIKKPFYEPEHRLPYRLDATDALLARVLSMPTPNVVDLLLCNVQAEGGAS